jgi:hypothetical protein
MKVEMEKWLGKPMTWGEFIMTIAAALGIQIQQAKETEKPLDE